MREPLPDGVDLAVVRRLELLQQLTEINRLRRQHAADRLEVERIRREAIARMRAAAEAS